MPKLTEAAARQALAEHRSPAADVQRYSARRVSGGWAFGWRQHDDGQPVEIGTIPWVVTDTSLVGGQRLGETAEQAIRRLINPGGRQKEALHE